MTEAGNCKKHIPILHQYLYNQLLYYIFMSKYQSFFKEIVF